jgi:AraC-like DNA-binding protein
VPSVTERRHRADRPQTVDEIAEISGLGTRTTFFRLFAARFGMTPDAYRTGNDPGKRRKS